MTGHGDPDEAVVKSHVAGQVGHVLANPRSAMGRSKLLVNEALAGGLADGLELEAAHVLAHLTREGDTAFAAFERRKEPA